MLDVLIQGGSLVDGTGAAARAADVGIHEGRIVAIGEIDEPARETIDATGKVVAPGFIDVHTHYDAQAFWDKTLSPSPYHGVTSVLGGNCGFSIAPLSTEAGPYLMKMLSRVEGMPLESLETGVPWDWQSFGDYLDRLDGTLAVNAGFLVGHSALRRVVMGERAVGEEATEEEIAEMVALLRQSLEEGGLGFSSTISPTHNDFDGNPVPSRHATREEMITLASQVRDFEGTVLEFLPGVGWGEEEANYMADLSVAGNRPVNWNALAADLDTPELIEGMLAATDIARARGGEVLALTIPQPATLRLNFDSGLVLDALEGWAPLFQLSKQDRISALQVPERRKQLEEDAQGSVAIMLQFADWPEYTVDQVQNPELVHYRGRKAGEIAEAEGKSAFDVVIDITVQDDLQTYFVPPVQGEDDETWKMRGDFWHDDRTVIGGSDAGAHLDMIDTFAFSSQVLGEGVRERKLISLEEAVHQITDRPARLWGLRQRGRIEEGFYADVVVFDPEQVGLGNTYTRYDLPAGAGRLYADANGIEHVFTNGVEIIRQGEDTGARPGIIMRSGRDTETVQMTKE